METVINEGRETMDEGRIEAVADPEGLMTRRALTLFVEAVELSEDLELIGTSIGGRPYSTASPVNRVSPLDEVFVIRDYSKAEGIDGAYVEVSIDEVIEKVTGIDRAQEFIRVIRNERKGIVLHGITRIVGYYSRVINWNKSKVGELRDRAQRNYGLTAESPRFDAERMNVIDSL